MRRLRLIAESSSLRAKLDFGPAHPDIEKMPVYPADFTKSVHNSWTERITRAVNERQGVRCGQYTQFSAQQLSRTAENYARLAQQTSSDREKREYLALHRLYKQQSEDARWREEADQGRLNKEEIANG